MTNKVVREGWVTNHPTSGKRVHVVNAAYCDQLEQENDMLQQKMSELIELKAKLAQDRKEKGIMLFDPVSGQAAKDQFTPHGYRTHHGLVAWLYNPWTGEPRDPRDIGSDVQGLLIAP